MTVSRVSSFQDPGYKEQTPSEICHPFAKEKARELAEVRDAC